MSNKEKSNSVKLLNQQFNNLKVLKEKMKKDISESESYINKILANKIFSNFEKQIKEKKDEPIVNLLSEKNVQHIDHINRMKAINKPIYLADCNNNECNIDNIIYVPDNLFTLIKDIMLKSDYIVKYYDLIVKNYIPGYTNPVIIKEVKVIRLSVEEENN